MRTFLVVFLCVAAVMCLAQGTLYAPRGGGGHGGGGHGGHGLGPGPGVGPTSDPNAPSADLAYVEGVIRAVKQDAGKDTGTITVGRKGDQGGDEVLVTLGVDGRTQVFVGDEPKGLGDLTVGRSVIAGFPRPRDGGTPVAILVRVLKETKPAAKKPDKPADNADDTKDVVEETK